MSEVNIQIGTTFNSFREISEKLLKDWSFSNYHVLKIFNSHKLNYMDDETQNRIVYNDIQVTCVHYGKPSSRHTPGNKRLNTKSLARDCKFSIWIR